MKIAVTPHSAIIFLYFSVRAHGSISIVLYCPGTELDGQCRHGVLESLSPSGMPLLGCAKSGKAEAKSGE
jgi:hypothetical protein